MAIGKKDSKAFCRHYDITKAGNFEGKSIPHLLHSDPGDKFFEPFLEHIRQYRRKRYQLHLDDKILTSWNAQMIAALCSLHPNSRERQRTATHSEGGSRRTAYLKGISCHRQ